MPAPFVLKGRHPKVQRRVRSHALVQRYFTDLEAASSMHYTIPEVTLAGDFRVEFDALGIGHYLAGNGGNDDYARIVVNGTRIVLASSNASFSSYQESFSVNDVDFTVLNSVSTTKSATEVDVSVNGESSIDLKSYPALTFNAIGKIWDLPTGSPYLTGYIANLKIYDNGTLIRHYPLDDAPDSTTIRELVSGADGTKVNITPAATELYTFNAQANQWESTTSSKVIPLPAELAGQFPYTLPMALS